MNAITHPLRAALYRVAFTAVRFFTIELPARFVRLIRRRDLHRATSQMHRYNPLRDPLQSLGGARNGPTPLRQSRRGDETTGSAEGESER